MRNAVYILRCGETDKSRVSQKAYDFVASLAKKQLFTDCVLKISADENGKPYFKNHPQFHFNISHSKDIIAVAVSSAPVGVDVEILRDVNLKIAERRFTEKEKDFVITNEDFFYVWTRKEAYLKKTGKGLRQSLSSFCVLDETNIKTFIMRECIVSVCGDDDKDFILIN